jgi:hypothetical protein
MKYLIVFFLAVLFGCRGGKHEQKTAVDVPVVKQDSTYLFDGKTLDGWEITNFGPQGPVEVNNGNIILVMGDGCTGVTLKRPFPVINYEVTLEAKRIAGSDFFCGMTFPVGKSPCTLIVGGWGGSTVGLSSINGKDASNNETTRVMNFDTDRWYRIKLRVTETEINAWIDDENVIKFQIGDKKLSIRPEVNLSQPFGIASWMTTAALRNIRVVRL